MKASTLIWLLIFFFTVKCNNTSENKVIKIRPGENELTDLNRYFVQKDRERIQNYIERKNLPMKESGSGLWYYIRKKGTGNYFSDNDKISINYVCSLLDGTECYNSE